MTDETEAAREYERLRGELAEFVLGILSERIAAGKEPELSQALVDAIDRRVDAAVSERLMEQRAIDRRSDRASGATERPRPGKLALYGVLGLAAIALIAFLFFRFLSSGSMSTTTPAPPTSAEPTIIEVDNGQAVTPGNLAAPAASNTATPR